MRRFMAAETKTKTQCAVPTVYSLSGPAHPLPAQRVDLITCTFVLIILRRRGPVAPIFPVAIGLGHLFTNMLILAALQQHLFIQQAQNFTGVQGVVIASQIQTE